ncbi:MAG: TldD/PmbA family protein [Thermoleophilia bacterium]
MSDLLVRGKELMARLPSLPGEVELFLEQSRSTTVKVYQGRVESLVRGEPSGVGVRYLVQGREGHAYTAGLEDEAFDAAVREAVENARAVDSDEAVGLIEGPAEYLDIPGLWRPGLAEAGVEERIALALAAERAALDSPEVETVEESVYSDTEGRVAILSTVGIEASAAQTFCYCYASAHARRDQDVQTGLGYDTGREPGELDPEAAGRMAGERAARLLGARPCPTGTYTIVLDREVTAAVLSVVVRALSAEAVQKGRSLFAGRLDREVAAPVVNLVDDGIHPEGMDSAPFDDEGTPRGRTVLIENGVLRTYLYDAYTARREGGGTRSTGNAHRGSYRGTPSVSSNNLILAEGRGGLEDLFRRVGDGLYVVGVKGLHSGANPVSGEFSVGVTGHLVEGGALGAGVREVTIASDLVSLLSSLADRAADARWIPFYGSALTPSVAIEGVTVSGT